MSFLFKRPDSAFFWASFKTTDGKRVRKSTGTADREQAQRILVDWSNAVRSALRDELLADRVRKTFDEILAAAGEASIQGETPISWSKQWLASKTSSRNKRTGERYQQIIKDFITFLGDKASRPLRAVRGDDVRQFRDLQLADGKAIVTTNLAHKIISSFFQSAVRAGLLDKNPSTQTDYLPKFHQEQIEKETFSTQEVQKLLSCASDDWKGVILLGFFAGLRLGDCLRMKWENVDLQTGLLNITPSKTQRLGKKLVIPLHPELMQFFENHPTSDQLNAQIFTTIHQLGIGGRSGASSSFSRIMERAKIHTGSSRASTGGKGRQVKARSFHSLRHSYTTALATAGVPVEVRMKLLGHSSESQNVHYTHSELSQLKAAVAGLPSFN